MSFPLPQGVCRQVCRPVRFPPRLTGWKEAVRFAKAAVKNGDEPCFVAEQVAKAVGCELSACGKEVDAVIAAGKIASASWADVLTALLGLIEAITGLTLTLGPGGQIPEPEGWWPRFLRLLRRIIRPAEFIDALLTLVQAIDDFDEAFYDLRGALDALEKCKEGQREN